MAGAGGGEVPDVLEDDFTAREPSGNVGRFAASGAEDSGLTGRPPLARGRETETTASG
jgi:hypothetical protein